ncbi:MAG TPA: TonB-dependent receptor [Cytophagales bacterium]|nr:TonB-dependent receptor [Cytophagales bacterium]
MLDFRKIPLWRLLLVILFPGLSYAQTTVKGTVTDEKSKEPLIGVSIVIEGKVIGTITDADGNFSLTTKDAPPLTLVFSMVGYKTQEVVLNDASETLNIALQEQVIQGQEVVISASRVQESILKSPVSIEKLDALSIRETPAENYYKSIANLRGVDMTSSSINFQIINARGFNSTGNERFVQLIDGMDTQAPALNFPIGNLNGPNELDVESVELIPGAASALYGPNAFNGILLINSKDPFRYQGLSAYAKVGINHVGESDVDVKPMYEAAVRYAKAFNNRFAFKANLSYSRAEDWYGKNQDDIAQNRRPEGFTSNPGEDRVHAFGEVANVSLPLVGFSLAGSDNPLVNNVRGYLGDLPNVIVARTPYEERHLVDYNAENFKANTGFHFRINEKIEASINGNYGFGTSVYTGGNRYSLKNFSIGQIKLELKGDNFFLRGYTTLERSGKSYIADAVGANINREWSDNPITPGDGNSDWFATYAIAYLSALKASGASPGSGSQLDPATQEQLHAIARGAADQGRWAPGTENFNEAKEKYQNLTIPEGGKFKDKTNLYHGEGQYNFKNQIKFINLIAGASYRFYDLNSNGTIFPDTTGNNITIFEYGAYLQAMKTFLDEKLKLTASIRYDKNENFEGRLNPRISGVYTLANNHNFRLSYQTGFRNPTTQGQHIDLNVGNTRILGGLPFYADNYDAYENAYTLESVNNYIAAVSAQGTSNALINPANLALLEKVEQFDPVKPEKIIAWEVGYKSLINNKLMFDISYYYNTFQDFIVQNQIRKAAGDISVNPINAQALLTNNNNSYQIYTNLDKSITAQGLAAGVNYSFPNYYSAGINYNWNKLNTDLGNGVLNQFNTPENKVNISFGNRKLTDNLGFNLVWRWQEAFRWESTFAVGDVPAFQTLDAQVSYRLPDIKTVVKLGGSNIFNKQYIQNYGGPTIGAIYYVSLTFDELFNN